MVQVEVAVQGVVFFVGEFLGLGGVDPVCEKKGGKTATGNTHVMTTKSISSGEISDR